MKQPKIKLSDIKWLCSKNIEEEVIPIVLNSQKSKIKNLFTDEIISLPVHADRYSAENSAIQYALQIKTVLHIAY